MLTNYSLSDAGAFQAAKSSDFIQLADGVHSAADHGQGKISASEGSIVELHFEKFTDQAQWLEVAFKLGAGAWLERSRYMFRIFADANHGCAVATALRLHHETGLEDIFAPQKLALSTESQWVGCEIIPPVWALQKCVAMDVHLFLPPRNGHLRIHDFAVTAVG